MHRQIHRLHILGQRPQRDVIHACLCNNAQGAVVEGNITGSDVRLGGFVTGNVQSNGQVILGKKSKLQGDIVYRKLLIEDGAKFEGKCDLIDIEEKT